MLSDDPLTQLAFSVYENKGVFALLLGSGLSRAADIPTGWEITVDLIRRIAKAQGIDDQADWAQWYREKTGEEPNYSTILAELALTPDERRSILHSYIEPTEEDREQGRKVPTNAHRAIAELVRAGFVRVIITTNFDRLMENALREAGVEPTVIASANALAGAEPITHSACYLLKLHGDYKDARILNTDEELAAYPAKYRQLLARIFDEHGLIICGWSGEWDHALRGALLRAPSRRYPVHWAMRGPLKDAAQGIADHHRARTVQITDADSFFSGLQRRVETLEQSHRQNPLSIDLLVSSAKRFLSKPEFRIQLEELIAEETARLLERLEAPEFEAQGDWNAEAFNTRVARYEAATEALARVAGVLGRWGDGRELPLVTDIIRALYSHAEKVGSGLTVYLNIRSYPAVLIFTAYGIGLTRAERWATLRAFLTAQVHREYKEAKRAVDLLYLFGWKGGDNDLWKRLNGLDRRKTPLSDHLLDLFADWAKSFISVAPDFELLFERFEVLASLAHFETNDKAEVRQVLSGDPQNGWTWMPIGREAWHEKNRDILLGELQRDPLKSAVLEAGFAAGDAEMLEMFIQNFGRLAGKFRWM